MDAVRSHFKLLLVMWPKEINEIAMFGLYKKILLVLWTEKRLRKNDGCKVVLPV